MRLIDIMIDLEDEDFNNKDIKKRTYETWQTIINEDGETIIIKKDENNS